MKLGAKDRAVCVDCDLKHWISKSPLCLAADNNVQALRLLLQYGADPWQRIFQAESEPTTPLLRAASYSSLDVVYEMVQGWLVSGRNAGYNG